jgi:hypothetical protein
VTIYVSGVSVPDVIGKTEPAAKTALGSSIGKTQLDKYCGTKRGDDVVTDQDPQASNGAVSRDLKINITVRQWTGVCPSLPNDTTTKPTDGGRI